MDFNSGVGMPIEKKKNKGLIIGIVIVLLCALLGGGYYYINSTFKVDKFIERNAKLLKSALNIIETENNNNDLLKDDFTFDGKYSVTTTSTDYAFINNLELDIKSSISLNSELADADITIKQNDASISTSLNLEETKLYLSSNEIYTGILTKTIDSNIFKTIKEGLKDNSNISKDDINYIINKTIDYFVESLKEAKLETNYTGINVEYKITVTKEEAKKIENKFKELVKNDERLSKYFNFAEMGMEKADLSTDDLETMDITITIKQNMINRNIEGFEVISGEEKLVGEKDSSGNFTAKIDGKTIFTIKKIAYGYEFTTYDNEKEDYKAVIVIDGKTMNISFSQKDSKDEIKLILKGISKNEMGISISVKIESLEGNFDANIKEENNKTNIIGSVEVKQAKEKTNISFNQTYGKLDTKMEKKVYSNTTRLEDLTDTEMSEIMTNLQEKLSKFKFAEYLTLMLNANQNQDVPDIDLTI